jgi:hypothetical protein
VRKLYEESALPIREIARLVGVTERTIYKYAHKHQWKPRYLWNYEGTRPRPRGTGWRARGTMTPVQGAGGRFIARDDRGRPVATGLKSTDPEAAARAGAECAAAALREYEAYVNAVRIRHGTERDRVWRRIIRALGAVERYRQRDAQESMRSKFGRMGHPGQRAEYVRERLAASARNGEAHDRRERPLWAEVRAAREQLHALRAEQDRTMADLKAQRPSSTS